MAKKRGSKKGRRTTHRSVSGTRLYAIRDSHGRFKDIQTYRRAHGQDMKRMSKKEKSTGSAGTNNTGPRRK